jgi:hypothetical protein
MLFRSIILDNLSSVLLEVCNKNSSYTFGKVVECSTLVPCADYLTLSLTTFSTEDLSNDPIPHVTAFEGHFELMISPNVHTVKLFRQRLTVYCWQHRYLLLPYTGAIFWALFSVTLSSLFFHNVYIVCVIHNPYLHEGQAIFFKFSEKCYIRESIERNPQHFMELTFTRAHHWPIPSQTVEFTPSPLVFKSSLAHNLIWKEWQTFLIRVMCVQLCTVCNTPFRLLWQHRLLGTIDYQHSLGYSPKCMRFMACDIIHPVNRHVLMVPFSSISAPWGMQ